MRGPRDSRTSRARSLRARQTLAEARLWSQLRNRRLAGIKFVRQEPAGPYVVDFACRAGLLVVEIDGATHSTQREIDHDGRRTAYLESLGYRIVRVTDEEIYRNLDGVLETILAAMQAGR